jgi:hypothetical protein
MTFVHISLLAGAAFISLPLMLHFLGRREPKQITFPALRFVRQTAVQSQRGWSIKRWLLLLLRMLLIGLAAVALAGPRVHSAMHATYVGLGLTALLALFATAAAMLALASRRPRSIRLATGFIAVVLWIAFGAWSSYAALRGEAAPSQSSNGPICAAMIIDNGPAMDYRHANQSRLDIAKETARRLMEQMPSESQFAVVTSGQGQRLHTGRISAGRQLDNVKLEGRASNLPERIRAAVDLVRTSKFDRREVYVLTDLSANAWPSIGDQSLVELLKTKANQSPVLLQIVDIGTTRRENWTLHDLKLSQEVVSPDGAVELRATVTASADTPAGQTAVELLIEHRDSRLPTIRNGQVVVPTSEVKDRINVEVPTGGKAEVRFNLRDMEAGTTHGRLRLTRPDPLAIDNELAFTVEAVASEQLLVLGEPNESTTNMATTAARMLDPELKQVALHPFSDLSRLDPADFDAMLMIEPTRLEEAVVSKISAAVESGKGLMIVLGRGASSEQDWRDSPTARLLPGKVARLWRRPLDDDSYYFVSLKPLHPLWNIFGRTVADIPWNRYPVFKYWELNELAPESNILVRYSVSGHPAIVEQNRGAGRIIVVTTPMTDSDLPENPPWNRLWATTDAWPDFGLMIGAMRYLSNNGNAKRNFLVGASPSLDNPVEKYPTRYDLFSPNGEVVRVQAQSNQIGYSFAQQPGTYRLRSVQADRSALRGFSVQLDSRAVDLTKIAPSELDRLLGANQFYLVEDREHLQSSIGQARFGKDLGPFLLSVLFLIFVAEQAMSYRFYRIGAKGAV